MYVPQHFEETRPEFLHALIRQNALATIVVHDDTGLAADHVPLLLRIGPDQKPELLGHLARPNPLAQKAVGGRECLVLFQGPQHYISPSAYATKAAGGKVVPTWNYEVVHVRGRIHAVDDPVWLRGLLDELTRTHEAAQAHPWSIQDAPADYLEGLLRGIVGIRVEITQMIGKAKLSQNQPPENRHSLVAALRASGDSAALAMAKAVEARAPGTL